jgi:PHO85 cyclin-5
MAQDIPTAHPDTLSPSSPPLPSPLLRPHHAFLASLILASKFTHDKRYSTRACAKLSGLPHEIGYCECVLSNALEWRLWVCKMPSPAPSSCPDPNVRVVVRCQSGGNLLSGSTPGWKVPLASATVGKPSSQLSNMRRSVGLRQCATLPTVGHSEQQQSSSAIAV